eukprot:SM000089S23863  [mRNA]  locus=s89:448777:450535:+ [translate_table: standard]
MAALAAARAAAFTLAAAMACAVAYTCATDGSPFRTDILTPWMKATLLDFYLNVAVLICWVLYKEDSWLAGAAWSIGLICLGSIATYTYIGVQLLKLGPGDPLHVILLKERHASKGGRATSWARTQLTSILLEDA